MAATPLFSPDIFPSPLVIPPSVTSMLACTVMPGRFYHCQRPVKSPSRPSTAVSSMVHTQFPCFPSTLTLHLGIPIPLPALVRSLHIKHIIAPALSQPYPFKPNQVK